MPRFRLLMGTYQCDNDKGEPVTYRPGEVIDTDIDLTQRFGAAKFQPLDKDIQTVPNDGNYNSFPGGQVSEGVQKTVAGQPLGTDQYTQEELARRMRAGEDETQQKRQGRDERKRTENLEGQDAEHLRAQKQAAELSGREADEAAGKPKAGEQEKSKEEGQKAKEEQQRKRQKPDFDRMSLNDLNAYAAEEEIDLKGAKTRNDVLKALKSS